MRHVLPAVRLFNLAPLVAEFLLGNLPITALPSLALLAPHYGGGAVLIRETVRRAGRGWPSMLLLALAYGILEEGIATMSLFNPNYAGQRLLDTGFVSWLLMGGPWTVLVLTLHVVWSIGVPIATVEALAYTRRTTPWLGRLGLGLMAVAFLLGLVGTTAFSITQFHFVASFPRIAFSVLAAPALVTVGLVLMPREREMHAAALGSVPSAWLVGVSAFLVSLAFKMLLPGWAPWLYVGVILGLAVLATAFVLLWSGRRGWGDAHRLALAAGCLLTYACTAFPQMPVIPASPTEDLIGNTIFAGGAVLLISVAAMRLRRRPGDNANTVQTGAEPGDADHRTSSRVGY